MLLQFTPSGIYCRQAGVFIDPWKPVDRALITHAHSDHARMGSKYYLSHKDSASILRYRLGDISLQTMDYNEVIDLNGVKVSLHPAGHITGSAQVRLEYKGEIWVVSGDYKVKRDGLTVPFEPVRCQHFITESTFGMPVYKFPEADTVHGQINNWVNDNVSQGYNSVLIGYALGKAQRILDALTTTRPILLHSTIHNTNEAVGFDNSRFIKFTSEFKKEDIFPGVVVATGTALGSAWMRRFEPYRLALCSGWMQLRGARRRSNADKGFVMSDHADWDGLNNAVLATGAENVYVTHGYKSTYARWLREAYKLNAVEVETQFEGEGLQGESAAEPPEVSNEDPS
jgi:putative mRNA 3-end processing factor